MKLVGTMRRAPPLVAHRGRRRRELAALAYQGRLLARGLIGGGFRQDMSAAPRVAVFVHGYLAGGPVFDPMRSRVETDLDLPTLDFTYGPFGRFESVLARFERHIDVHVKKGAQISLVGHSLGGIIARAYLHECEGGARVDRVLTIATPHGGTTSVRYLPGGPARALHPRSPILSRLAERHGERPDVRHVAVIAGADRVCSPPESAGELVGAEVHRFDGVGHNEILFDSRVHDVVTRHLR